VYSIFVASGLLSYALASPEKQDLMGILCKGERGAGIPNCEPPFLFLGEVEHLSRWFFVVWGELFLPRIELLCKHFLGRRVRHH